MGLGLLETPRWSSRPTDTSLKCQHHLRRVAATVRRPFCPEGGHLPPCLAPSRRKGSNTPRHAGERKNPAHARGETGPNRDTHFKHASRSGISWALSSNLTCSRSFRGAGPVLGVESAEGEGSVWCPWGGGRFHRMDNSTGQELIWAEALRQRRTPTGTCAAGR